MTDSDWRIQADQIWQTVQGVEKKPKYRSWYASCTAAFRKVKSLVNHCEKHEHYPYPFRCRNRPLKEKLDKYNRFYDAKSS